MFWDKKKHRYSSVASSSSGTPSPTSNDNNNNNKMMESYSFDSDNEKNDEKSMAVDASSTTKTTNPTSNTQTAVVNRRIATTTTMISRSNRTISMKFVKCISGFYCQDCGTDPLFNGSGGGGGGATSSPSASDSPPSGLANLKTLQHASSSSISPLVLAPMMMKDTTAASSTMPGTATATATATTISNQQSSENKNNMNIGNNTTTATTTTNFTVESIMGEYMALCQFYKIPYNAGVLSTLRFSLPCLRVTGSFHDMDMLAVTELLLHHANTTLRFITRLDFSIASKEGRQFRSIKVGFTSHGALALAKLLQTTKYVKQVWLPRHRIGPYGGSAIFLACQENQTIQTLNMRRCRLGERGAFAFVESMSATKVRGLIDVDLSSNGIGHRGTVAIQKLQDQQNASLNTTNAQQPLFINLEGNLVFPEIMNAITHCVGVILSLLGSYLLSERVKGLGPIHTVSCAIYSTSLLALYISSTLYHSFFPLQNTKYIFQVFDKCAIYVLIAGSYTPFLQILLGDKPIWSIGLLGFIWLCGLTGIGVEAFCPTWKYRSYFSLAMYLGMGWACLVCMPTLKERLAKGCINLVVLGGVGYTSGVPFFVRNNNLDHAIWHLFVLSGSIFHWLALYVYVAPFPLEHFYDTS